MSFVVDASVAIAWAFNERHATAAHTRAGIRAEAAIVPSLWWYEVRNVLVLGPTGTGKEVIARYNAITGGK